MSWKVWKGKDKRADEEKLKGENFRNQGKFADAAHSFQTAAELYSKSDQPEAAKILSTLASLFRAVENPTTENFVMCSKLAAELGKDIQLETPKQISAADLSYEAKLLASYLKLSNSFSHLDSEDLHLADSYDNLANELSMMPNEHFTLSDFTSIQKFVSEGRSEISSRLRGLSFMIRGNAVIAEDPTKAKEFFETAKVHFLMAKSGPKSNAEDISRKLEQLAKCWFCSREVQGEDYHFVHLSAILSPYVKEKFKDEHPSSMYEDKIVACTPCRSSILNIAEKIARVYYEKSLAEINAVRKELVAEISNLKSRLSNLERVGLFKK